jgi:hypothetical protein
MRIGLQQVVQVKYIDMYSMRGLTVPGGNVVEDQMDRLAICVSRHEIIKIEYVWNTVYAQYEVSPLLVAAHAHF